MVPSLQVPYAVYNDAIGTNAKLSRVRMHDARNFDVTSVWVIVRLRTMYRYAKDRTAWMARAPPTASKLTKTKQPSADHLQFAEP